MWLSLVIKHLNIRMFNKRQTHNPTEKMGQTGCNLEVRGLISHHRHFFYFEIKILNNYAKSKYEAELMIEMLCENQDYIIIRPSRIIGPSIFPNEDSVVGYVFFSKALKEKRIDLFGDIYRETNLIDNRDISKAIANLITSKK